MMFAGNLWEWTLETAYNKELIHSGNINYNSYMLRGGGFLNVYENFPACFRGSDDACAPDTSTYCGFRPVLFLQ
ncbi:MAG: formylglycine-generating enzyme family protein [Clostridia bacterium]|nr:formylglycine-generating enzyme family protein [Clostridia bacterium]